MSYILEVQNVVKRYADKTALNGVSLAIPKGSVFGLLGPNGAGKTSLIRIINQITYPDSGQILLDGEPLQAHHVKNIGYMPEERGLYKSMKVGEQALYLAQLKGLSKQEARKQLDYWFQKLEITSWWDKKIHELSKGMAQKIQFVVTVLHNPKLLIFDEPFSGFDPVNANLIKDEILELKAKGSTIIFSTHRMESVEEMCDHIALIHQSNKLIDGKLMDVKRQHRTNLYEIGIKTQRREELIALLNANGFTTSDSSFKTLDDDLQLKIHIPNQDINSLLQLVFPFGQISHFAENIPSINDIFIQTVSQK